MARINPAKRLLTVKLVYYGPGLCGKTTNLTHIHNAYPSAERGDLVTLDTETERTLFFDYFPANLGTIGGYKLKADFFTVPGQSFYNATRKAVLDSVDGIVFVADSLPQREDANITSLDNLKRNLEESGRKLEDIPHVYQWNKRDAPGAISEAFLNRTLNAEGAPAVPAVAINGEGVWETQAAILKLVLDDIRSRARRRKE